MRRRYRKRRLWWLTLLCAAVLTVALIVAGVHLKTLLSRLAVT